MDKEILRATKAEKVLTDNLNLEVERATAAESTLTNNLNKEITRAKKAENDEETRATNAERIIADKLTKEVNRASSAEATFRDNLDREVERATGSEKLIQSNIDAEVTRAKAKEAQIDNALADRYTKNQIFTKDEVLEKIQNVIGTAPAALDTLKEIADSLNNDSNFAGTMTNMLSEKVDKVAGKQLSTNDFDNTQKSNLADCNTKKHTHTNKSVLDGITSTLITAWNSAVTHISDAVKHITSAERTLWNTVSNKAEKSHTHTKNQIIDMPTKLSQFTNDNGFITRDQIDTSQNHTHTNKSTLDKISDTDLNRIRSRGVVTPETGTTIPAISGMSMTQAYNNGYPSNYGNIISLSGSGHGEIFVGWSGTSGANAPVYVRSKRDVGNADWSPWVQFYTSANPQPSTASATKATQDSDGNQINTTYVKKGTTWNELEGI